MSNLPNCPICLNPADWMNFTEPNEIEVFFCMDCCEHFTKEDTVTSMKKRAELSSSPIDEIFLFSLISHESDIATIQLIDR